MRSEAIPSEARKSDKVLPDRTYYATPGPRDVGPGGFSIVSDGASSNDQEGEEVKKEDRVPRGGVEGGRCVGAWGLTSRVVTRTESSLHSVDVVAADKGDAWAHYAFESLVEAAMLSEKRVLIARYCFRKDSQPRMVALIPKKGAGVGPWSSFGQQVTLVMGNPPLPEEPTAEQKAFTNSLVDALTFDPQTLRPEETSNPSLARFYDFLGRRAVDPGAKLESSVAAPVLEMPEHARLALEKVLPENERLKVKASFGLEKVEKAVGRERKRHRREDPERRIHRRSGMDSAKDIKKIKVDAYTGAKKTEEKEEDKAPLRASLEDWGWLDAMDVDVSDGSDFVDDVGNMVLYRPPMANKSLAGQNVILHTDGVKTYKMKVPGVLHDNVAHKKRKMLVKGKQVHLGGSRSFSFDLPVRAPAGPLRHVKGEESQEHRGDDSMAVPVGVPPRVHIGSVNPQQDFERWLNERKTGGQDVVTPAIE
ncbi:X-ray repair cross-complementing protein 5 [Durusdinium trenchii]|uniref:X-ray repair cross-complementing protein 5 n=1 Tax=Durusdinium trenchii TaxID=1381693 RepID=A0ABP0NVM7_9DINO